VVGYHTIGFRRLDNLLIYDNMPRKSKRSKRSRIFFHEDFTSSPEAGSPPSPKRRRQRRRKQRVEEEPLIIHPSAKVDELCLKLYKIVLVWKDLEIAIAQREEYEKKMKKAERKIDIIENRVRKEMNANYKLAKRVEDELLLL
jgi:hypothetical protein